MTRNFDVQLCDIQEYSCIRVKGVINEDNTLAELARHLGSKKIVINLEGVTNINSCGARDWVRFVNALQEDGAKLVFHHVPPCMVHHINMVNNFLGGGLLRSVRLPYYCQHCDSESLIPVETASLDRASPKAPNKRCDKCDNVLEFDDMQELFFEFMSRSRTAYAGEEGRELTEVLEEWEERGTSAMVSFVGSQTSSEQGRSFRSSDRISVRRPSQRGIASSPEFAPNVHGQPAHVPPSSMSHKEGLIKRIIFALVICSVGLVAYLMFMR